LDGGSGRLSNYDVMLDGRGSSQSIGDRQPDVLGAHVDEGQHQVQTGTEITTWRRAPIVGPFVGAGARGAARGLPVERDRRAGHRTRWAVGEAGRRTGRREWGGRYYGMPTDRRWSGSVGDCESRLLVAPAGGGEGA